VERAKFGCFPQRAAFTALLPSFLVSIALALHCGIGAIKREMN
jgi:hypothetical protein